jgi:hypothetical protein
MSMGGSSEAAKVSLVFFSFQFSSIYSTNAWYCGGVMDGEERIGEKENLIKEGRKLKMVLLVTFNVERPISGHESMEMERRGERERACKCIIWLSHACFHVVIRLDGWCLRGNNLSDLICS